MAVRIICIKREKSATQNPYLEIDYLEWINERINVKGVTDRIKLHDWLKEEKGEAYIIDEGGNRFNLVAAISAEGDKYVKTSDDEKADRLLKLPGCV
jgi:hypothetical protein